MTSEQPAPQFPDPTEEGKALRQFLDSLPVYAVRIGYQKDRSTEQDTAFADKVFDLHERWLEIQDD